MGIDTETTGINPTKEAPANRAGRIAFWSLSWARQPDGYGNRVFLTAGTLPVLREWLESAEHPKVGHNVISFDKHMFANEGIDLQGTVCDTLRFHQLLYTSKDVSKSLKSLMKYWLGYEPVGAFLDLFSQPRVKYQYLGEPKKTKRTVLGGKIPTLTGGDSYRILAGRDPVDISKIPTEYPHLYETLLDYATLDAKATIELYWKLLERSRISEPGKLLRTPVGARSGGALADGASGAPFRPGGKPEEPGAGPQG